MVYYICMQKGTKQTDEARAAISERMRKHWANISAETRSEIAKRNADVRKARR